MNLSLMTSVKKAIAFWKIKKQQMDLKKILLTRFIPISRDFVPMMPTSRALLGQQLCWHNQALTLAVLPCVSQVQAVRHLWWNHCWQREVSPLSPAPALFCFQEANSAPFTQPLVSSLPFFPDTRGHRKPVHGSGQSSTQQFQHGIIYSSCHNVQEEHLSC